MRIRHFLALLLSFILVASLAIAPLGIVAESPADDLPVTEQAVGELSTLEPDSEATGEGVTPSDGEDVPAGEIPTEVPTEGEATVPPADDAVTVEPAAQGFMEEPVVEALAEGLAEEETPAPPVNQPVTEDPAAEEQTQAPADTETTEPPANEPVTEEPAVEEPVEAEPVVEALAEDLVDEEAPAPAAEDAVTEEQADEGPVQEPVVEAPVAEEPVAEELTQGLAEEEAPAQAADGAATEELAAEEPVKQEPVIDVPAEVSAEEAPTALPADDAVTEEQADEEPAIQEQSEVPADTETSAPPMARMMLAATEAPVIEIRLNKTTVAVGQPITATIQISGGAEPYQNVYYHWYPYQDNRQIGHQTAVIKDGVSTYTPTAGNRGQMTIVLVDANGKQHQQNANFAITGGQPITFADVSISFDKDTVAVGETIQATVSIAGGAMPYQKVTGHWYVFENGKQVGTYGADIVGGKSSFTPDRGQSGKLGINVTDANGIWTLADSPNFTIGTLMPVSISIQLNKTSVRVGEEIQAQVTLTGGKLPYKNVVYVWNVFEGENHVLSADRSAVDGLTRFTPAFGDNGHLMMIVVDAEDTLHNFTSTPFAITGAPPSTPFDVQIKLDKTSIAVGQTLNATWTVSGGTAPYEQLYVQWLVEQADGSGNSVIADAAEGRASYTAVGGVRGKLLVSYKDAMGRYIDKESPYFTITDAPAKPRIEITLDKTTVAVGQPISASWKVLNAPQGATTWAIWMVNQGTFSGDAHEEFGKTASIFTPQFGLSGWLEVYLVDKDGNQLDIAAESSRFTITGWTPDENTPVLPSDARVEITLNKDTVAAGQPITASWEVIGAPEDFDLSVAVIWHVEDSNGNIGYEMYHYESATGSSTFTPKFGQTGGLNVEAYSQESGVGHSKSGYASFAITGGSNAPKLTVSGKLNASKVQVGQPITATWAVEGGVGPYTMLCEWHDGGPGTDEELFPSTEPTSTFIPRSAGRGGCYIRIWDAQGRETFADLVFEIEPAADADAPRIEITLDKTTVAVGQPVTATWQVINAPEGAFTRADWTISDDGQSGNGELVVHGQTTSTFTPTHGIAGWFTVDLMDKTGNRLNVFTGAEFAITGSAPIPAIPADARIELVLSADSVAIGKPLSATWKVVGASAEWDLEVLCAWIVNDSEGNSRASYETYHAASGTTSFTAPLFGNQGLLAISAYDRQQGILYSISGMGEFAVTGGSSAPKLTVTGSLDNAKVKAGTPITATWTVEGGVKPYTMAYSWRLEGQNENDVATFETTATFIPPTGTGGTCRITAEDAQGRKAYKYLYFAVEPGPASTPSPTPPPPTPAPTAQPTARPTAEPTARPTARPTAQPTAQPVVQPVASPVAQPSPQPVVLASMSTLVRNERSQSVPFVATQQTALDGHKKLIITAQDVAPVAGTPEEQQDTTIYWDFTPDFVQEAQALGATTVTAAAREVSIEISLDELKSVPAQQAVVSLARVQAASYPEALQQLMPTVVRQTEVYTLHVGSRPDGAPVEVELSIPYDGQAAYQLVELRPDGQILYSEVTSLVVQDGMIHLLGTVQNGSTFFLAQK